MFVLNRRARNGITAILLVVVLLQAFAVKAQAPAQAVGTKVYLPLITTPAAASVEQQLLDLTNQQRRSNGCFVDLTLSPELTQAAIGHSRDMAINNVFSHFGSDGSTISMRVTSAGYSYQMLAENIAAGYSTAQSVVTSWMSSAGHRANILNCSFREIGIGFYDQPGDQATVRDDNGKLGGPYRYYWTQDFGTSQ